MKGLSYLILVLLAFFNIASANTIGLASETIASRIKPVGEVNIEKPGAPNSLQTTQPPSVQPAVAQSNLPAPVAANPAAPPADTGKKIYDTKCVVCHGSGLLNAPKFGDINAWKPRLTQKEDVLFEHVKNGYKNMPAKGTCVECTDADLKAALEYMTSHSK